LRSPPELAFHFRGGWQCLSNVTNWHNKNSVRKVESVEVEFNSLNTHHETHRANYMYLYEAIRKRWYENRLFDLKYNVLQSNPDYLGSVDI